MFKCGNYGQGLFAATAGSLRRLVNIVGCSVGAAADVLLSDPLHVSSTKAKNGAKGLWLHPRWLVQKSVSPRSTIGNAIFPLWC